MRETVHFGGSRGVVCKTLRPQLLTNVWDRVSCPACLLKRGVYP